MSGWGRAWTCFDPSEVRRLCRESDQRGIYTSVHLEGGVEMTDGKCNVREIDVDLDSFRWREAGVEASVEFITLGEGDVACWSLSERLRRPQDFQRRFLQILDSAAFTGALLKGWSPSRKLNLRCRRAGSYCLARGLEPFLGWCRSERNSSDRPSRRWEGERRAKVGVQPLPSGKRCRPSGLLSVIPG